MNDQQMQVDVEDETRAFESFFVQNEPRIRAALVALVGAEAGREAAAEAFRYGWEHRTKVLAMDNPAGYLYLLGRRWSQRQSGRNRAWSGFVVVHPSSPDYEPRLASALTHLSTRQRQAVILVTGYGLTHQEAADVLGVARTSIQNHAERGLRKLRSQLGVTP